MARKPKVAKVLVDFDIKMVEPEKEVVESIVAKGLMLDDADPASHEGIVIDEGYLNISINSGGWDILMFAPKRDSRLCKENLKFLGLVIEDDSENVGLRKEWRSPIFGNCEYTIDPYLSPAKKNDGTNYPQQTYKMSTVSTFLDDDNDRDLHKFSIVYYDRRADKVRVFDPGISNQED